MSVLGIGLGRRLRDLVAASRVDRLAYRVTLRAMRQGDVDAVLLGHRYELVSVVGRGSHGVVFAAYDRTVQREVALKVFRLASERAVDEAQALARVNHPNVVTLYDIDHANGFTYLVMELVVVGWTMRQRVGMGLDWRTVVELFIAGARGLAAAHQVGIVHGDVKPDNILVGRDGSVRVVDFELSRRLDRASAGYTGTREYLAPECWAGADASPYSDQFSLCVSLWEALYGARPWDANRSLTPEPRRLHACGEIPPQIERALRRGLAADPLDRHPDIQALIDELEDALQWGST